MFITPSGWKKQLWVSHHFPNATASLTLFLVKGVRNSWVWRFPAKKCSPLGLRNFPARKNEIVKTSRSLGGQKLHTIKWHKMTHLPFRNSCNTPLTPIPVPRRISPLPRAWRPRCSSRTSWRWAWRLPKEPKAFRQQKGCTTKGCWTSTLKIQGYGKSIHCKCMPESPPHRFWHLLKMGFIQQITASRF